MAPGATPWRWSFPARNRIMAALGRMTIVVEAATRSGSLITAELAAESGRDVGAVPGPGQLARLGRRQRAAGARRLRGPRRPGRPRRDPRARRGRPEADGGGRWTPRLARVLAGLERAGTRTRWPASSVSPAGSVSEALARLELLGYVSCSALGEYTRTALIPPGEATT